MRLHRRGPRVGAQGVADHRHHAPVHRPPALGPRAARGSTPARGCPSRCSPTRRPMPPRETADTLSMAAARAAREPVAGRARGVPAARGVRLRLRRDRRDRREERGQLPPARRPRAPARGRRGGRGSSRHGAARGAGAALLRRPAGGRDRAAVSSCWPRTRRSTATAAARRRRSASRCSARDRVRAPAARLLAAPRAAQGRGCSRSRSTASRVRSALNADGVTDRRDGAGHRRTGRSRRSARSRTPTRSLTSRARSCRACRRP